MVTSLKFTRKIHAQNKTRQADAKSYYKSITSIHLPFQGGVGRRAERPPEVPAASGERAGDLADEVPSAGAGRREEPRAAS